MILFSLCKLHKSQRNMSSYLFKTCLICGLILAIDCDSKSIKAMSELRTPFVTHFIQYFKTGDIIPSDSAFSYIIHWVFFLIGWFQSAYILGSPFAQIKEENTGDSTKLYRGRASDTSDQKFQAYMYDSTPRHEESFITVVTFKISTQGKFEITEVSVRFVSDGSPVVDAYIASGGFGEDDMVLRIYSAETRSIQYEVTVFGKDRQWDDLNHSTAVCSELCWNSVNKIKLLMKKVQCIHREFT